MSSLNKYAHDQEGFFLREGVTGHPGTQQSSVLDTQGGSVVMEKRFWVQLGLHVVQFPSLVYVVCVLWWAVDLIRPLPVTAGRGTWPWSGGIQSAENREMSRYINWSITSAAACFSHPLWLLSFLMKVLRRHIGEMGGTVAPPSSLSSWTLCTCSPLHSSMFLMLVYTGKDTTWGFLIYCNLHYRCTEHWLLFTVLWCICINLI